MKNSLMFPYNGSKLSLSNKLQREADIMNLDTYAYWFYRITEIAVNGFRWKNLPEKVDERYLEMILAFNGRAVFFRDDVIGYAALEMSSDGEYDIYDIPQKRVAYGLNGYFNTELNADNSVIIYNNYTRTPEILTIRLYAQRLSEIDKAIDINIRTQKTTKILKCAEEERLTYQNLLNKYDGGTPFILGSKNLATLGDIETLDLTTPYIADKLQVQKRQVFNEVLTYFGIENANTEKRERLVTDEITSNMGGVAISRNSRMNARKKACKEINRIFGLNLKVEFSAEIEIPESRINENINDNINEGSEEA